MKVAIFALIVGLGSVVGVVAQDLTITNAEIEKFRQKRLAAEREYRENYAKMGFPSPAELEKQLEQDRLDNEKLAARLSQERVERERIEAMRMQAAAQAAAGPQTVITMQQPQQQTYNPYWNPYGLPPYILYPNRFPRRFPF
jgi:hypothetical protein